MSELHTLRPHPNLPLGWVECCWYNYYLGILFSAHYVLNLYLVQVPIISHEGSLFIYVLVCYSLHSGWFHSGCEASSPRCVQPPVCVCAGPAAHWDLWVECQLADATNHDLAPLGRSSQLHTTHTPNIDWSVTQNDGQNVESIRNSWEIEWKRDCHTLTVSVKAGAWTHFDFLLQVLGDEVGESAIMAHCAFQFQSTRDSSPAALACHGSNATSARLTDSVQTLTVLHSSHHPLPSRSGTHPYLCHHVSRPWPIFRCWQHGRRDWTRGRRWDQRRGLVRGRGSRWMATIIRITVDWLCNCGLRSGGVFSGLFYWLRK